MKNKDHITPVHMSVIDMCDDITAAIISNNLPLVRLRFNELEKHLVSLEQAERKKPKTKTALNRKIL